MIQKEVLHGGRRGKISKEEDKVIRPGNKWTSHVQSFLSFMHENGFNNIPKPYGINESGMEMVSFVDGTVYNDSLPNEILTNEILVEVAKLLRRYHDIGEKYVHRLTGEEVWMLPKQLPVEVMCHGDFAPYNITFVDGCVHGIIDLIHYIQDQEFGMLHMQYIDGFRLFHRKILIIIIIYMNRFVD